MLIYRYHEPRMSAPGATVPYDLRPAGQAWSYMTTTKGEVVWVNRAKDQNEVYLPLDECPNMVTAQHLWYTIRAQADYLFGEDRHENPQAITLLHRDGHQVYLGMLVTFGVTDLMGEAEPPGWWCAPWPKLIVPTVYEHLLDD